MERFRWDLRNLVIYAAATCAVRNVGFAIAYLLDQRQGEGSSHHRGLTLCGIGRGHRRSVALVDATHGHQPAAAQPGIIDTKFAWNADPKLGVLAISIAAAWQFTGYVMSLYLAGLRGISDEIRGPHVDSASTCALPPHHHPPAHARHVQPSCSRACDRSTFDLGSSCRVRPFPPTCSPFTCTRRPLAQYRFSLGATIGFFMILLSACSSGYLRSMGVSGV